MGRFLRLSDEELSRLLAGETADGDEALEEVASLLGELRGAYAASAPDADTRTRHIAALAEVSRLLAEKGNPVARPVSKAHGPISVQVSGLPKWRRVRDRMISIALKAVAGTVAASMSLMGLAYAGVDLPGEAAANALEAVTGVELPNQGEEQDKSVADDVKGAVDSDLEGCERGQAVADAADANRQDDDASETDTDPCTEDETEGAQGGKATGDEKSAEGRGTASDKSEGRSDAGASNADGAGADAGTTGSTDGRDKASDKSGGASDSDASTGDEKSDAGQNNNPSGQGSDSGDEKSDAGQNNNPSGRGSGSRDESADAGQSLNPVGN